MSRRRARTWLRHPPVTIHRTLTCPTGMPRHASENLALTIGGLAVVASGLSAYPCPQCDNGWHLTTDSQDPAEDT